MNTEQEARQIQHLLAGSSRICIVPGNEYPLDTLPSALGLTHALRQLKKHVYISYPYPLPALLRFLPLSQYIKESRVQECTVEIGVRDLTINAYFNNQQHTPTIYSDEHASSCSELVTKFLKTTWDNQINKEVATGLLTGLIAHTDNFQRTRVRPQTLFAAAYLIAKNAERDTIIQELYKKRSLEFIRLWGRVLANLQYETTHNVAWSIITYNDFNETGASPSDISHLLREFVASVPQAFYTILLWEKDGEYDSIIHTQNEKGVESLFHLIGGTQKKNNLLVTLNAESPKEAINIILRTLNQI